MYSTFLVSTKIRKSWPTIRQPAAIASATVCLVLWIVSMSGCGSNRARFSPVAAVARVEHEKGVHVREVSCIEQGRSTEYTCSVVLAHGQEHRVSVVATMNGQAVGSVRVEEASRSAPPTPKGFRRVVEHEPASGKSYEKRSYNLPDVTSTG